MINQYPIPIIDLFAGPGGLGEGFSSVRENGKPFFDIRLSIEKDPIAHRTLTLRATYRALVEAGNVPEVYYDYIKGRVSREGFYSHPDITGAYNHAKHEAQCIELGKDRPEYVDGLISNALNGHEDWVLIGGPPCQAYSLAGRSRRKGDETFQDDPKHFLYREYLRIIERFKPAVFVMENVKGMLSSKHGGTSIYDRIIADLRRPGYVIRSFVVPGAISDDETSLKPSSFVIHAEEYGIPQMRHRVILLGVREDRHSMLHSVIAKAARPVTVKHAIGKMPKIRSRLSKEVDSAEAWQLALEGAKEAIKNLAEPLQNNLLSVMRPSIATAAGLVSAGNRFVPCDTHLADTESTLGKWLYDPRLGGVCQHETRSHIRSDLQRYLFSACYAVHYKYSPKLKNMPDELLPNHKNVTAKHVPFDDRFRVQVWDAPSTTVVSHISKDGHYYIHPDPAQCRSLTVREAARLQTFPDNYFFEGERTQQYHQVGNAVPPLLAKQLGDVVRAFLKQPKA